MSTLTAPAPRLVTRPFALACGAALANLTAFYLPLSVVPARAVAAGAPDGAAGLVTAALMLGGVLAECVAPRLMARFGDRAVLATGLLLLGGAALLLVPAVDVVSAVLVCGLRGLGFGFAVVVTGALVTRHVPAARRGEGLAVAGVAACVPAVAALPAGVWLADAYGPDVVFVVAALVALVGALAPLALGRAPGPRGRPRSRPQSRKPYAPRQLGRTRPWPRGHGAGVGRSRGGPRSRRPPLRRPGWSASPASRCSGGRPCCSPPRPWRRGSWSRTCRWPRRDPPSPSACSCRRSPRPRPATARAAGATGTATPGWSGPAWRPAGSGWSCCSASTSPPCCSRRWRCSGPASGVAQSATYAVMVERAPAGGDGAVSALWNLAYDLGYGVGPLAFAAVVGASGYPAAFALTGLVVLAGLRAARRIG